MAWLAFIASYLTKIETKTSSPSTNTIFVFIDASNLWQAQKAKGRFLDYGKTVAYIKSRYGGTDLRVFYYTAYPADGTRPYSIDGKHRFLTYLKKGLGFEVQKKPLKRIALTDVQGEAILEKGNMDVEMTIDAVHRVSQFDTAVLFSGDSDFLALVRYLKRAGKRVHVLSSKNNASQEMKTGADSYLDLLEVPVDIWGRELKRRNELAEAA